MIELDLIKYAAASGKPLIISTGSGTISEIQDAIDVVKEEGNLRICLLKCTSEYPASFQDMQLNTIPHLREIFECPVGLSDHSPGASVPIAAVTLGASVIEKHFTISREVQTVDSFFSLHFEEFKLMVKSVREAEAALGEVSYPETANQTRRSIHAVTDLHVGDVISSSNVRSLRPGGGIPPKELPLVLGKKLKKNVKAGDPLLWDHTEG